MDDYDDDGDDDDDATTIVPQTELVPVRFWLRKRFSFSKMPSETSS